MKELLTNWSKDVCNNYYVPGIGTDWKWEMELFYTHLKLQGNGCVGLYIHLEEHKLVLQGIKQSINQNCQQ